MSQKAKIWKLFAIRNHLRSPFRETRNYRKRRHLCGGLMAHCRKYRIFANRHTANIIISQIAILISQMSKKAKIWKLFAIRDHLRSSFREMRNYRKSLMYEMKSPDGPLSQISYFSKSPCGEYNNIANRQSDFVNVAKGQNMEIVCDSQPFAKPNSQKVTFIKRHISYFRKSPYG